MQCAVPSHPYESSVSTNQSISVGTNDFTCALNYMWSDGLAGSTAKTAICTENATTHLSASWIVSDSTTCIGIITLTVIRLHGECHSFLTKKFT